MNQHLTIEKMKSMRLHGMAQVYYANQHDNLYSDHTLDQLVALMVDQEWDSRHNRKVANLIRRATFRSSVDINNIDYTAKRKLDKNTFERLAQLKFITQNENIIITGPTGTGKSYLAQVLAHQACIHLYKTKYLTMNQLIEQVSLSKIQGTYHKFIKTLQRIELLIIDDFGLSPLDLNTRQAFMDIVEYKYNQSSMILTSQIPIDQWHQLIGEATIADAILDRLIHSSHRINLEGQSMRKNKNLN